MPSTDIIGYLWMKRQSFGIETPADAMDLVSDLLIAGLDCIQVEDQKTLGIITGATTSYPRKTQEEWDELVHKAIVDASVAQTIHMMTDREEDAE